VVLNIAGLARIDAAGLGALIRSQNLLASLGGELRLVNPSKLVGAILHRTRLDSVIPTFGVEAGNQERSREHGAVRTSAAAEANPWSDLASAGHQV
jgi:anti-anti-sigma regulatory factor